MMSSVTGKNFVRKKYFVYFIQSHKLFITFLKYQMSCFHFTFKDFEKYQTS